MNTQQQLSGLILNAEFRLRHPKHPHRDSIEASLKRWKQERETLRWEKIMLPKRNKLYNAAKLPKRKRIKDLKPGYGVNHPEHGYLQYRGEHNGKHIFWLPVDENGNTRPEVVIKDGTQFVELVEITDANQEDYE